MAKFKLKFWERDTKEARYPFISNITSRFVGSFGGRNQDFLSEYKNWVYACTNARSEYVGNIELILRDSNGDVVDKSDILDLINKVNPQMTKRDLFFATQAYLDLDGNAFWFLARDNDGKGDVKEIYIVRPDKMQIVPDKVNPMIVKGYIYRSDAKNQIPFEPNEILHFKNFNPKANHPLPHKGMGVVEASYFAIDTDNDARTWNSNFFKKSARPDGILYQEGEGVASPEEHKRLQEQWQETYQGAENAHKVAILSGGLKWQEIQRSQKDMDFVNQRTFSRDEILALFRTPKSILGITDDVNRANAEASIYVFTLMTIKPLMQKIVDTLNEFLVPDLDDSGVYFDFKSPVPDDRTVVTAEYTAGHNKWLTTNEIRAKEGLPPTENGDQIFAPFGLAPIDSVKPQPTKNAKPQKKAGKKSTTDVEKSVDSFIAKLPKEKEIKTVSDEVKTKYIELWKKAIDVNTGALVKKLTKYFEAQKKEVLANLESELKGLEAKEYKLKALTDVLFDEDQAISTGISLITPFIRSYLEQSGQQASTLVGGTFDNGTEALAKFVKTRANYFAETTNQTTADNIINTLKEGTDNGETFAELSKRIGNVYDDAVGYRAEMIARTEVSASANEGALQAYQQAGVEQIQWQVVNPKDEDCLVNDGQIVSIGDSFNSGDEQPPVHPNCECTTLPIF